jgi:N-acetylated-alpha-linked acidic dipeptidase
MGWLGSGSDYTAFVDHLGVPAADAGFRGGYGVYHSIYDSFNWMEKFGDPEFLSHATAARLYTLIAMRGAGADVVPLRLTPYGEALREHVDELRLIHARRVRQEDAPPSGSTGEFLGLKGLVEAVQEFQHDAGELDRCVDVLTTRNEISQAKLITLNDALIQVERAFLLGDGIPGRPWFKHAIYAPGLTTGYAAWPLPAIRQALEDKNAEQLARAIAATVGRIRKASEALRSAAAKARSAQED